ncbi:hypothetical protein SAY86_014434 [Trapa natans]|uniref:RRM domain-containing protein n=1 Tax=Trapa natans TaxID=22666 RepID=A0AAN7KU75_TRANT|nr:hypothetical protein SAY86_014434 [Trapa natans]
MAAFRGIRSSFLRPTCPSSSAAQLIFLRGIATRLFVKGVSFSTTDDTFKEAFSKYGEVIEASVIRDKDNGRSKGYGFVTFATSDDALRASDDMDGKVLDGRVIFVDLAKPRREFNNSMPVARGPPEPVEPAIDN